MIISKIIGGLGNQFFQYAVARKLAYELNTELYLDITGYKNQENITQREFHLDKYHSEFKIADSEIFSRKKITKVFKYRLLNFFYNNQFLLKINEKDKYFHPLNISKNDDIYLNGYWQSEEYFKNIRNIILNEFRLKQELNSKNKKMLNKIKKNNSVTVHFRRTDYVSDKKTNQFHGVCSKNYYKNAVEILNNKIRNPHYFIFSDDINWCKKNVRLDKNQTFVDINSEGYLDFELMKNCKHFIIANSTFSWWGAWLSTNKNKLVIAPQQWFNKKDEGDTIPRTWIRI